LVKTLTVEDGVVAYVIHLQNVSAQIAFVFEQHLVTLIAIGFYRINALLESLENPL
jgi:hypothetical protein